MRPLPWDLRLAARTLSLATVALVVVALVEGITDERGVSTPGSGGRSIGLLPLTPVAGAIAVAIALAPMSASGELRALAALGCSPWRARIAAIACATSLAVAGAVGIALGGSDVSALFPPPIPASDFRVLFTEEGATFVSDRRRVRVRVDDVLERTGEPEAPPSVVVARDRRKVLGASAAIAFAGIALAFWAGSPTRRGAIRTLLTMTSWGVSEVLLFQAAGAGALPPLTTTLPSVLLLIVVAIEHRRSTQLPREEAWI